MDRLGQLQVPTLVLAGHDFLFPPEHQLELAPQGEGLGAGGLTAPSGARPRKRSAYSSPWPGPSPAPVSSAAPPSWARLEAAFARARGGDPLTLCVGGEAGVGKTRLVTQFAGRVGSGGGQVLLGGCIELGEAALPYAPVVEALRGVGRGLEPAALDNLVGPGRPLLARLLPELGRGGEATPTGLAVGSSGQAQLFEAFLAVLERLADRSPTVLVLEDLHWADRSTLDLLAFLHRNLRSGLLLLLTYRTDELHRGHRLRPFLAGLDRSGRADRLELGRFGRVDVADLLASLLKARPDDDLVERIYRRSEGNAFFAEELLAATHEGDGDGRSLPRASRTSC